MAYQNLTLTNIAGEITATYNDNNMRRNVDVSAPTGPGLMLTGTAKKGLERFPFNANALSQAMQEFDSSSELSRMVAAAKQSAAQEVPLSIMRIGAKPNLIMLKKATAGLHEKDAWITIIPYATREANAAADILSTVNQLGVILMPFRDGNLIRQRVVLYNVSTARTVFDSEGLIADPAAEAIFDVEINVPVGSFLWTPKAFAAGTLSSVTTENIYTLADVVSGMQTKGGLALGALEATYLSDVNIVDQFAPSNQTLAAYNAANTTAVFTLDVVDGTNGDYIDNCERYAANDLAYEELEFENIAFLSCDKCYADVGPVELTATMSLNEQLSWQKNSLGYLWKYVFNGRPHMFMSRSLTPFSASNVGTYTHDGITYTLTDSGKALGDALNLVEFHLHPKAAGAATEVESFFTERGLVECNVEFDCDSASLVDASSLTEAEYEAYAGTGVVFLADATTDGYGWTEVKYDSLRGDTNFTTDGDPVLPRDTRTGLIESQHNTLMTVQVVIDYLAADDYSTWAGSDSKGRIAADFTTYQDAGHTPTIDIETPFCILNIPTQKFDTGASEYIKRYRPSLVGGARDLSDYCLATPSDPTVASGQYNDPFFMSHFELTGGPVPEAVMSRLFTFVDPTYAAAVLTAASTTTLIAANAEVREVSFLHQSATAAYTASTNYSQTIAIVPTTPPPKNRNGISAWAGNPAEYTVQVNGDVLVTKNGTGVLGTKLLAGAIDYRGGNAFGGIVLTNGDSLPNGIPYGIDDSDEALDAMGNAIDLGKHVVVVGAHGLINDPKTAFPNNSNKINIATSSAYTGSAGPIIAGMLAQQAPGTEPIGPIRGRVPGFDAKQRTPRAVLNNLAALRICMIDQTGIISSIYTAALRTSDYTKVSSILAANGILRRLRQECLSVIGSAYTDSEISSLASRLDGITKGLVAQGFAQQLNVGLRGSQLDRINGIIRLVVTFIPPLSIEAVTIELTLEPPASGI
ncbi:hypothetical protein CMI37_34030 [Candidatus Pacearchaeota archaeon]|nr:hypothetical protein [Candidatus Pacearchaeota archaeon]|tara:strand:+ start:900 stop:3830 length:2931 start_codon:yes stop_codon:yes gene_type:complete